MSKYVAAFYRVIQHAMDETDDGNIVQDYETIEEALIKAEKYDSMVEILNQFRKENSSEGKNKD